MTSALDITRAVNPPRAAFLDFPLGHTTGAPNDADLQQSILAEALSSFASMTTPGSVKTLPHLWPGDGGWKARAFAEGDERRPRHETPQYQCEDDRRRAERGVPPACPLSRS